MENATRFSLTPPNNPEHFDLNDVKAVRLETGKENEM